MRKSKSLRYIKEKERERGREMERGDAGEKERGGERLKKEGGEGEGEEKRREAIEMTKHLQEDRGAG